MVRPLVYGVVLLGVVLQGCGEAKPTSTGPAAPAATATPSAPAATPDFKMIVPEDVKDEIAADDACEAAGQRTHAQVEADPTSVDSLVPAVMKPAILKRMQVQAATNKRFKDAGFEFMCVDCSSACKEKAQTAPLDVDAPDFASHPPYILCKGGSIASPDGPQSERVCMANARTGRYLAAVKTEAACNAALVDRILADETSAANTKAKEIEAMRKKTDDKSKALVAQFDAKQTLDSMKPVWESIAAKQPKTLEEFADIPVAYMLDGMKKMLAMKKAAGGPGGNGMLELGAAVARAEAADQSARMHKAVNHQGVLSDGA